MSTTQLQRAVLVRYPERRPLPLEQDPLGAVSLQNSASQRVIVPAVANKRVHPKQITDKNLIGH